MAAAKADAESDGRELLTPAGAVSLFGVTNATVRTARLRGNVETGATLRVTGKDIHLLLLRSAIAYWQPAPHRNQDAIRRELKRMREFALTIWLPPHYYNILHPAPLLGLTS